MPLCADGGVLGENRKLKGKIAGLEREVIILRHEAGNAVAAGDGGSGGADGATVAKLRGKVEKLQADLTNRCVLGPVAAGRGCVLYFFPGRPAAGESDGVCMWCHGSLMENSANQKARLDALKKNEDLRTELDEAKSSLGVTEQQLRDSMAQATDLKSAMTELNDQMNLLRTELAAARVSFLTLLCPVAPWKLADVCPFNLLGQEAGEKASEENTTLRAENEQLISRIMDEKMRAVEEVNKLNAEVETLRRRSSSVSAARMAPLLSSGTLLTLFLFSCAISGWGIACGHIRRLGRSR